MKVSIIQCESKNKFPFNAFALLIKKFQKTNYSHYALFYVNETGSITVCDSTAYGVRRMPEKKFLKKYHIRKTFRCKKDVERGMFLSWFEKHEGKSYGFRQILGLALKIFHLVKTNPFGKGSKRIICNELIVLFLNRFYGANVKDTDSLDLVETQQLLFNLRIKSTS